jgi:hypothetical protein
MLKMDEILDDLKDFGAADKLRQEFQEDTSLSLNFANVIAEICEKIRQLVTTTEENVNKVESVSNLPSWKLEVASFLRELQCPHNFLIIGEVEHRLEDSKHRLFLLQFLQAELITAKYVAKSSQKNGPSTTKNANLTPINGILHSLKLSNPPGDVSAQALFAKIVARIEELPTNVKSNVICDPIFSGLALNKSQWKDLDEVIFT